MSQDSFDHGELDTCFANQDHNPMYSPAHGEDLEELDFRLDDDSTAPTDSSNTTIASTPDFAGYTFGKRGAAIAPAYPPPGYNSPHPYSLELHHGFPPTPQLAQRPAPLRSHTSSSFLHPPQYFSRTQQPYHRRSLSQGDADRIAAATQSNPVFFRLQVPRARPATPLEDDISRLRKRMGPYDDGGRSLSQSPGNSMGRNTPTSTPMPVHEDAYGIVSTYIGMPMTSEASFMDTEGLSVQLTSTNDSSFRHMSHHDQVSQSRRVIEIGAMAVVNAARVDPSLARKRSRLPGLDIEEPGRDAEQGRREILKKLEELEHHLKHELYDCDEALKACGMIREALASKTKDDAQVLEHQAAERCNGVRTPIAALLGCRDPDGRPAKVDDGDDILAPPSQVIPIGDDELYHNASHGDLFNIFTKGRRESEMETHGL
ncbi:hypothetical protein BU26DRAFT_563140 [Trematosphaeria pertusa]|uniref:Uncharacterized protein n=1 Tax=Trematosphaeria pertusa TaxID=390896 RepID=A0A6A6INP5_9PLEO|nr:uncharacterized protein BU26DRAFT_563140 [Trematosphaeria pertusa]KAF2251200.1 hypothetical protein BU26DRAFT_563140 [Trematosphaeria pertusa]